MLNTTPDNVLSFGDAVMAEDVDAGLIDELTELIELAKQGKVKAVIGVVLTKDEEYPLVAGVEALQRSIKALGAIEVMKLELISQAGMMPMQTSLI